MLFGNAIIGQSGGPTSAINATLSGAIRASFENRDAIKCLFGMKNGIEGLLREEFVDLFSFFEDKSALSILEQTPSSALGSCRMRLPSYESDDKIYLRIFEILKKHNVRYFFYIGGNDSMDTVAKLSSYAQENGIEICVVGVPKTVDNDLFVTDHTPGYGSCAKYIATTLEEIIRDVSAYTEKSVTVVEIMGRDAGWLTAAASLCGRTNGKPVDLIYLPERVFCIDSFLKDVKNALMKTPNVTVAVSEGIKDKNGSYISIDREKNADSYGHSYLSGVSRVLSSVINREIGCKTRAIELSLPQRAGAHIASKTDICESVEVGKYAVNLALSGKSGVLPVIKRQEGEKYKITLECASAQEVANKVKRVPPHFINEAGNYVTDECVEYVLPLVHGEHYPSYKDGLPIHCVIDKYMS